MYQTYLSFKLSFKKRMCFSTMRVTCLTLLPDHPYSTQPQVQTFKLLVMHFFQPPVISYMLYFIHMLYATKESIVIMRECLKLGWKCIFTHVTSDQRLSEKAFIF